MRKMRDFPSCFNESGVQISESSNNNIKATQDLITAVYQCQLQGVPCFISVTWTKSLMGQGVSVGIQNSSSKSLCKFDVKPWLFSRRKGFRSLDIGSSIIDLYWNFSSAKFESKPEPVSGFYLAIVFDQELVLLLGDLDREVHKKINIPIPVVSTKTAAFVAKREHIFGKKFFSAKGQFCGEGKIHDIQIECDTGTIQDPFMMIRIDGKAVIQVKRLWWKFRGNNTILVDGLPVEVYWDVHSWLFGNTNMGNAVFLFQTSFSPQTRHHGFSLILYAWKNE